MAEADDGLFLIDAEEGDTSEWTDVTIEGDNTFTATEGSKNNGTYGFDMKWAGVDNNITTYYTMGNQTDVYARFYIYFDSTHGYGDTVAYLERVGFWDATTTVSRFRCWYNAGGAGAMGYRLYSTDNDAEDVIIDHWADQIFSFDTWYRIEQRWLKGSSSDGGAELWIDGVSQGSDYTQTNDNYDVDRFYLAANGGTPSSETHIYFDDIKLDTSYIGAYSVGGGATPTLALSSLHSMNMRRR